MNEQDRRDPAHEDSFVALFSAHKARLYAFILTLVVRTHEADEAFQTTSMVLWQKFPQFKRGTSFWSWACQVAYYEVLKLRDARSRRPVFSDATVENLVGDMAVDETNASLADQALRECSKKLDRQFQELIELRYYRDLAPKQIAEQQNRSQQSVYRSLCKAHGLLQRCIEARLAEEGR